MKRNHVTIRPIDRHNLKQEFVLFKELYNAAWEKNWGFVPMTEKELDALVKSLGQFFDPDLAFFGYVDGEPAGFIMAVPDFNQVLQSGLCQARHTRSPHLCLKRSTTGRSTRSSTGRASR